VSQLRQRADELERLGVDVLVVSFEAGPMVLAYARATGLPFPIVVDEERELYRAYGMLLGHKRDVWGPASMLAYLRLMLRGRRLSPPTGDTAQLGGDVLIDPAGVVQVQHVGTGPADRPAIDELLDVVRTAG
jgi:alkyl hydroperoxide reductase subunit AhpC